MDSAKVVARDFIPAFTAIQSTGLIPSVTALKKAEVQFHQYGATILDDMLRLGQISDVADDEKPNVGGRRGAISRSKPS